MLRQGKFLGDPLPIFHYIMLADNIIKSVFCMKSFITHFSLRCLFNFKSLMNTLESCDNCIFFHHLHSKNYDTYAIYVKELALILTAHDEIGDIPAIYHVFYILINCILRYNMKQCSKPMIEYCNPTFLVDDQYSIIDSSDHILDVFAHLPRITLCI